MSRIPRVMTGMPYGRSDFVDSNAGATVTDVRIEQEFDHYSDGNRFSISFDIITHGDRPNALEVIRAAARGISMALSHCFGISEPTPEDLYGGEVPKRKAKPKEPDLSQFKTKRKIDLGDDDE